MKSLFRTKSNERILADAESGEHPAAPDARRAAPHAARHRLHHRRRDFRALRHAAAAHAGPAVSLSYAFSALACVFAGLCYAEFASMIPVAGSAYTYAYATLGELFAWIIGWDLILEYLFGAATVAVGWSGYVTSFLKGLGVILPEKFCCSPFTFDHAHGVALSGNFGNWPAALILIVVTGLLATGIRESANFNNILVAVKLVVILLFIGFGIRYVHPENWTPFVPPNTGEFGAFGWSGVLRGAGVVFFSYIGFDAVSTAAQEAKDPRRDLPRGILWSLGICTVLYVIVSLVLTGLVHYSKLGGPEPMATGIDAAGPALAWLAPYIKLGAIAGLSSVILVLMLGQTRVFFSMAKDRLLRTVSRVSTRVSGRRRSPRCSPARSPRSSPRFSPSTCSARWCPSARCSRS